MSPVSKPWELKAFFRPLREGPFFLNALGLVFFTWGLFVPFNFLVVEAQHHGMNNDLANYRIAILNGVRLETSHSILPGIYFPILYSHNPHEFTPIHNHSPNLQCLRLHNPRMARRPLRSFQYHDSHHCAVHNLRVGPLDSSQHQRSHHCIFRPFRIHIRDFCLLNSCPHSADLPCGGDWLAFRDHACHG